jgi:hypothetical protein
MVLKWEHSFIHHNKKKNALKMSFASKHTLQDEQQEASRNRIASGDGLLLDKVLKVN